MTMERNLVLRQDDGTKLGHALGEQGLAVPLDELGVIPGVGEVLTLELTLSQTFGNSQRWKVLTLELTP